MAQAGLQCGFGNPLGVETLAEVKTQGFTIVRVDLQEVSHGATYDLAQEVVDAGLQPLCIIRRVGQMALLPEGALVELGNEPNDPGFGWTRASYRAEADKCVVEATRTGQRLYVGVVNNLHHDGFAFLRDLPWHAYPVEVCCSFHRYPEANGKPSDPHKGSRSRADEMATLRQIVGARPLACSEVGYNDKEWNEQEVADNMAWERRFALEQGLDFVVAYQLNDSPPGTEHDPDYGFRRYGTSTWKPVTQVFVGAI